MEYKEIKQLLDKYLQGESSQQEEALLKAWFASQKNIPHELDWAKDIFGYVQAKGQVKKKPVSRKLIAYSIAASIALLVSVLFLMKPASELKIVANNGEEVIELQIDEHCHVWLNKNTTISYSEKNTTTITIDGEAYFELKADSKRQYKINAHNAVVSCGTESTFNINAYDSLQSIEVAVSNGALNVAESGNEDGMLLFVDKGNYCSVHRSSKMMYSSALTNSNYLAWKTGELNFINQPLKTVTDALAEYFRVEIKIDNRDLALCSFTGSFKRETLEAVLKEIQKTKEIQITTTGNVISLSGGNCITN